MAERKIVIKINYSANPTFDNDSTIRAEQNVTEWNKKRIVAVCLLMVLLGTGGYYGLSNFFPRQPEEMETALREADAPPPRSAESRKVSLSKVEFSPQDSIKRKLSLQADTVQTEKREEPPMEMSPVPAQTPEAARVIEAPKGPSVGVVRAQLTRGIENKEPVDKLDSPIAVRTDRLMRLYYFTEIRNMTGDTITHRWLYGEKPVARIRFRIGGGRWRVYSSKFLDRTRLGTWRVVVEDSSGKQLKTDRFELVK